MSINYAYNEILNEAANDDALYLRLFSLDNKTNEVKVQRIDTVENINGEYIVNTQQSKTYLITAQKDIVNRLTARFMSTCDAEGIGCDDH